MHSSTGWMLLEIGSTSKVVCLYPNSDQVQINTATAPKAGQSQHVPGHQPTCWDPSGARVPINSLSYAESTSIYNPNFDCDSDGYDEDFDVGYSRQPYHQQHSVPHHRQAAACLEQPAAQQQPLLQLPSSCRHPSSGTLDEETCFMDDKIDYLSDNEKGVSITATGTLPARLTPLSPNASHISISTIIHISCSHKLQSCRRAAPM
ncbi:hypothetical protein SASPL_132932 [Salvia splendens]|uniref:Uncharacterized protein n=1 Tax=Salvia splendens TaxID=180675 RepID=A0A8X8ZHY8_SALSN|nr:hypothetical protein SASPL_132932 [Salvia splendens]